MVVRSKGKSLTMAQEAVLGAFMREHTTICFHTGLTRQKLPAISKELRMDRRQVGRWMESVIALLNGRRKALVNSALDYVGVPRGNRGIKAVSRRPLRIADPISNRTRKRKAVSQRRITRSESAASAANLRRLNTWHDPPPPPPVKRQKVQENPYENIITQDHDPLHSPLSKEMTVSPDKKSKTSKTPGQGRASMPPRRLPTPALTTSSQTATQYFKRVPIVMHNTASTFMRSWNPSEVDVNCKPLEPVSIENAITDWVVPSSVTSIPEPLIVMARQMKLIAV